MQEVGEEKAAPHPKHAARMRLSDPKARRATKTEERGRERGDKKERERASSGKRQPSAALLWHRGMAVAPCVPSLRSSFLLSSPHPKLSLSFKPPTTQRPSVASYPRIRALELDQNTIVAISVGVVSVAVGIGIPVFYETQIDNSAKRENTQPCFPCNGSGAQQCRFCTGTGRVTVVLSGGETEVSRCISCEGAGTLTCTTCQGTGIQPRYLDRREFKDDD